MNFRLHLIALGLLLPVTQASADLLNNLVAYYDFEETGTSGLANKAPGATSFNATRAGSNIAFTDWSSGANSTGPGFSGKADFTAAGTSGVSDRSALRVGNALNLDDDRDEYVVVPVGTSQLGTSFTIAAWHKLTPGAANTSNRYHVFEAAENFDVSWGTLNTAFTAPQTSYQYLAYVGESPAGGFGPTGVTTNQWHHIAYSVSSDGTTSTLRIYIDGSFFSSRTVATSLISFTNLHFGRHRAVAGDRDWDGMFDEVALWNRSLSANDVKELYLRGNSSIALTTDLATLNKAFVSVISSNPSGGSAFGTDLYNVGDTAVIQASPASGYVFSGWTTPHASEPDSFDLNVTASEEITAAFSQDLADEDADGLSNFAELTIHNTSPTVADTDGDLILDGQEINTTQTNPNVSQTPAINWIIANLNSGGGTSPGDIVLSRNTINNTVTLHVNSRESTTLNGDWSTISSAASGVSAAVEGGSVKIVIPGNSESKRFFQTSGTAP